jgi:hypothetical protein
MRCHLALNMSLDMSRHNSGLLVSEVLPGHYDSRRIKILCESKTMLSFVHCLCCLFNVWMDHLLFRWDWAVKEIRGH